MSCCGLRKLYFKLKYNSYALLRSQQDLFSARLAFGKKLDSNSAFMFSKKLCAKLNLTHRVIFFITLISITIACFGTIVLICVRRLPFGG